MARAKANGIELEYDEKGAGDPLLLIMGLGAQMTRWPPALIDKLVDAGHRVVWYDNRDVGLSSRIESAGMPDMGAVIAALQKGEKPPVSYTLDDMAADAAGLLDALSIANAHIVGASMGGMIAQQLAAHYPQKVRSLTSIMSSTGNPGLPRATPEALAVLTQRGPDPSTDFEGFLAHSVRSARTIGSPAFPLDESVLRTRAEDDFRRAYYPIGFQRQYAGVMASGDRRAALKKITAPTVVIHGEVDPLVPLAGGRDTAENIKGAELKIIPGMGHDLPPGVIDDVVAGILSVVARARN